MIGKLGLRISDVFRRVAPDPFVLAVLLTLVTFALVLIRTDTGFSAAVGMWSTGLWGLLGFSMQMCLILVTGHALASSPPVDAALRRLAGTPHSASQAAALVATVAVTLGLLNWGLGLIAGALMARRVGLAMERKGVRAHYPLLAAAGYLGLMVWHGGFSGTAPLKVTDLAQIQDTFKSGAPFDPIPLSRTILSPMNLFITGGMCVIAVALVAMMSPRDTSIARGPSFFGVTDEPRAAPLRGESDRGVLPRILEDSPLVTVALAALIAWWAFGYYLPRRDGGVEWSSSGLLTLTPDTVNLTMLMLGLALHGTPMRYVRAVEDATRGCAGIILQFPLYAGIMGLMASSGVAADLSQTIAGTSNGRTFPLLTFLSAGIVNLFVPSGGGQWAVQGPIAIPAGLAAGVAPEKTVMAIAYGDQLTNMLQPFWALPLLAITGLRAREIVGYTAIVMVVAAVWIALGLLLWG